MIVIKSRDKDSFVKNYNSVLPDKNFKNSCIKAGELFSAKKKYVK